MVNDGANDSNLAVAVISVTATNDAPVITVDPSAAYVENAAPVVLAPLATLSDVDDTELHGALVSITAGSFPGDGDILSVGGVTSNTVNGITFTWMPAQHALVFSGASSVANYQALLQQVQFQSSSDNPTDFGHSPQRTLTWAVTDSASVTTATTTINIGAVNDAPQETVAATAAYTENGSPVTISPAATANDVDNSDLIYGGVRIVAGGFDGDVLTVNGLQSGTFAGINFSYDAGLQRLLFESPAAVADYQALMRAVQFGSTSENPTNFGANPTRTLGWGLSDGEDYSSPAQTTQITITALNDAPVNTVPGAQTVAEDTILPIVGVSVADIDSSALTTTLSVAHGILNVTAGPGVTGNGTASVTITGTAAEINAALAGLAYTGNLNFNGADTLTVATSDGTATDTDTIAITVNAVNDAPVLNLDADSSTIGGADYLTTFTDGGPAVAIVDTDVSVIDTDSPRLASATVTLTNPQALDRLTFTGPAPGSIIVAGSGTSVTHAHGRRIGCRLSDGTAANHVRQHRHQSFDRDPHHRRGRQRRDGGKQYCACDRRGHPGQQQCTHPRSRRRQLDAPRNELPHDVHRERDGGRNRGHRYPHRRSRYRQHDRFGDHHADEPADRRSADRHPAVAGRHHRFRLQPGHRNPDALRRRFVRRLRDCAGGDPLQLGWRQSGCGKPHHSSRRQ